MNLLKSLIRNKPANKLEKTDAPTLPQPTADGNLPLIKQDRSPELINTYDQGMIDGLLDSNTEHFERFIDAYHFREFKNKSIYHIREQIKDLLKQQLEEKQQYAVLSTRKHLKEAEKESIQFRLNHLEKVLAFWKEEQAIAQAAMQQIKANQSDYPLLPGILFFFFACLFIAADYTICLNIVADTLKIGLTQDGEKTFSSHLFALAMSGLAVVLKPAYDRLIEEPYHNQNKKRRFAWCISIIALSVLGMLFALGLFREDVIKHSISLEQSSTDIVMEGTAAAVNSGFEHEWARKVGIVSSTLLFAIAGAVCLGISLPVIHKNFRIHWNLAVIRNRKKKVLKIFQKQAEYESDKVKACTEIEDLQEQMQRLVPAIEIDEEVKEKRMLIPLYQHGEMVKNIAKSTALYLAAVDRGRKLAGQVPQDWIFDQAYRNQTTEQNHSPIIPINSKTVTNSPTAGRRTRPFVALRRLIAQQVRNSEAVDKNIDVDIIQLD